MNCKDNRSKSALHRKDYTSNEQNRNHSPLIKTQEKTYSSMLREKYDNEKSINMVIINYLDYSQLRVSPLKRSEKSFGSAMKKQPSKEKVISLKNAINASNIVRNNSKSKIVSTTNDSVRVHLRRIFEYYCQFGERMNFSYLKSHKFQKFAVDADLIDSKLTKTRLELIFTSENKTKIKSQMNFETFLNSLIKLAEAKFVENKMDILNKYNKAASPLQSLLKFHIWPLYERLFEVPVNLGNKEPNKEQNREETNEPSAIKIKNSNTSITSSIKHTNEGGLVTQGNAVNTSYGQRLSINSMNIINNLVNFENLLGDTLLANLMRSISSIMYEIYKVYFPWELSLSENENFLREHSTKAYFQFLKEYDLCPSLVHKSAAFQIFNLETEGQTSGSNTHEVYENLVKNIEVNPLGRSNNKSYLGKFFTFFMFVRSIFKIGDLGFDRSEYQEENSSLNNLVNQSLNLSLQNYKKLSHVEKICLTLERMELSDGFHNLEQKTNKTHSRKSACIIPREILEKVKLNIDSKVQENKNLLNESNMDDAQNAEMVQHNHRMTKIRKSVLGNFRDLFEHTNYILEKFGEPLNILFKSYCSFGDPLNTTQMKTNKFSKLLNDAKLIKKSSESVGIKMNDVDVIFFKLAGVNLSSGEALSRSSLKLDQSVISNISNNISSSAQKSITLGMKDKRGSVINSNAKIEFTGFINAIEIISLQIFPNRNEMEAIDHIVVNNLLPLLENFAHKNNELYKLICQEKVENKEFVTCLEITFKSMTNIFKFYMNKQGMMTFDAFLKFCSDFSIFPDLISKSKLNLFFKTSFDASLIFTENGENELIDQSTFLDILAQCAFDLPYRSPEPGCVEKIILFMEKLSQSEGPEKIIASFGHTRLPSGEKIDILHLFRVYYPGFFTQVEEKKVGFFDVLDDGDNY